MKRLLLIAATSMAACVSALAQSIYTANEDSWYFGVSGGVHASKLLYTDLDSKYFPDNKYTTSGVFGIFARKSFGVEHNFMLRPEILFLNRGGKIENIYNVGDYYKTNRLDNISYRLQGHYIDLRVPLMYQAGYNGSKIRPYIFIAPVASICTGGNINYHKAFNFTDYTEGVNYQGAELDLTKTNINQWYLAGEAGVGLNWYFNVDSYRCFLGMEANYEYGFTNTYGKDNSAEHKILLNPDGSRVEGSRRMHGFEVRLSIGVPLSAFCGKKDVAYVEIPEEIVPAVEAPAVEEEIETVEISRPCYSLEEINTMIAKGMSVEGRTICAIDDMINFEFGKSDILPQSYDYLNSLAETLKRINGNVLIKGHTDNIGEEEYNMRLSRDRAMSVYNYLINRGVPTQKLSYAWFGMSQPIADNDTEEGRRMNRRVEFEIR